MSSINIIYASTSGHTEYTVEEIKKYLTKKNSKLAISLIRVEKATVEDITGADITILASGCWNTGGVEGQLNIHMYEFLEKQAADIELDKQKMAFVVLGDDRYFYTCRGIEHFMQYMMSHNGAMQCEALLVVNEPYGQEKRMHDWCDKFLASLQTS